MACPLERTVRVFGRREHRAYRLHFDAFLSEAVSMDPGSDRGLDREELFGLYTSWCLLTGRAPQPETILWLALRDRGITPGRNSVAMTGPAARDYIVASAPSVA